MTPAAEYLKQDGNRHFQTGDFTGAEALYSKAIIAEPREPTLYTNRAMARLKLSLWDLVIADCEECLRLGPNNMKAHYYLAQAHLALRNFDDALAHALRAHQLCTDKSLESITQLVLRCKKDRWEDKERRRLREGSALESQMLELMGCRRDAELNEAHGRGDDQSDIRAEWEEKFEAIKAIFEKARAADDKKRVVPDWVVDDIGFGIMVDPVVTKTGKSYEKSSILEHLRRHQTDPLTREPLLPSDLRPNLDLKHACEEFLDENGWAVDW